MKNKKPSFGKLFGLLGLGLIASLSSAQLLSLPKALTVQPALLTSHPTTFESEWADIAAFINTHGIYPDGATVATLKGQTQQGVHDWWCVGGGLGWPQSANASMSQMIYFDTEQNAEACAAAIIDLAERQ